MSTWPQREDHEERVPGAERSWLDEEGIAHGSFVVRVKRVWGGQGWRKEEDREVSVCYQRWPVCSARFPSLSTPPLKMPKLEGPSLLAVEIDDQGPVTCLHCLAGGP